MSELCHGSTRVFMPRPKKLRRCLVAWVAAVLLLGGAAGVAIDADAAVTTELADGGVALHAVIVSGDATQQTREAADTLADYLGRISGAEFSVEAGDGSSGIVVGTVGDFPALGLEDLFAPNEALRREEYLLRSRDNGVLLIGATELATRHAVWDLLYRLGHRQFFPGETWEVVPSRPTIDIAVDTFEQPDFHTRHIWYGFGLWDYNDEPLAEWRARNRGDGGFTLSTRHSYQSIMRRNEAAFEAHPEYLALVGGKRQGSKFCISNPDLRRLVVQDRLAWLGENPDADSVSLDPSDGGGWCECDDCAALGSITDQALLLANETAEAMAQPFPGKYVGLLAYNQHSPPPNIDVHPNVLIKIQTHFIRGGYSFHELIEGWQAKGATTGVGDYYSVFQSDMSRPASQDGSDLYYIRTSIPGFHSRGARFFMVESSDLWGAIGLGHYIAARLAWDVSDAERFDALTEDFITKAFGPAAEPMEGFFRLIYRFDKDDRRPMIRRSMLGRMYRFLAEARRLAADDPQVMARLDDLLLFTHYEELFQAYTSASGEARQKAVEAVIRHAWRMRETMMVHAKPIVNADSLRFIGKDNTVQAPAEAIVKVDQPFSAEELEQILTQGVASTEVVEVGFEPIPFSDALVPAAPLDLPEVERGHYNAVAPRGSQTFYTWLEQPGELRLRISGGHIEHYRNIASNVQTTLYADANPMVEEPVAQDESVPPDGDVREVVLKSEFEGLHRVHVWPPANRAMVDTADQDTPWTMVSSIDDHNSLSSRWSLYFYVPKGTKMVGGYASGGRGTILDGDGNAVFSFEDDMELPGYFSVRVPRGQDGRLWKLDRVSGARHLMTVPPFLARSARELLLPREVVEADAE